MSPAATGELARVSARLMGVVYLVLGAGEALVGVADLGKPHWVIPLALVHLSGGALLCRAAT